MVLLGPREQVQARPRSISRVAGDRHAATGESANAVEHDASQWMVEALMELYFANQREGERYAECFGRLGLRTYTAILNEALAV